MAVMILKKTLEHMILKNWTKTFFVEVFQLPSTDLQKCSCSKQGNRCVMHRWMNLCGSRESQDLYVCQILFVSPNGCFT
jgi:hypothetical protein